ncbi:MAG: polymer-forming cytoskeletal protein [Spirochaetia bacterium]|nr:polymer-forming cytoskeletal protein [Spirochaetia bacterium]
MAKSPNEDIKSITDADITTVLAEDIVFKGSIQFKTSLMIKGGFEGDIQSDGLLLIGPNARVKAQIKTSTLISYGKIEGNIQAAKSVVLCKASHHKGDIQTPNILIESGAVFNGSCVMPLEKEAAHQPHAQPHSDAAKK